MASAKDILLNPKPSIPEPIPLESQVEAALPLTKDMMPDDISDFVFDVAKRSQCPPEYVAISVMVVLGTIIGGKYTLLPKQHDNWEICPNFWGALIGPPSAMKSPAMKEALKPLHTLEKTLANAVREVMIEQATLAELEADVKKEKKAEAKQLYKSGDKEAALALMATTEPAETSKSLPRFIVNDATIEKLGELLNENPNGLMLLRDELSGLLSKLAREEGQTDRAFFLESFDGFGSYTCDRIGRGTIVIERCILSLLGSIQPSKISGIIHAAMSGKIDDGLIQRMQLAVWPEDTKGKKWIDNSPDPDAMKGYRDLVDKFHQLPCGEDGPTELRFTPEAQELFTTWWEALQQTIESEDLHPVMQSHLGKYPKTIGSLAMVFQLCTSQRDRVEKPAMELALKWFTFLKSHATKMYGAFDKAIMANAKRLLDRRDKLPDHFTIRDVRRKGWAGLKENADINAALEILLDHHHLIDFHQPAGAKGGRPTTIYRWNPAYKKLE